MTQSPVAVRMFKGFAALVALSVLAVLLLFVSLWIEHRVGLTLPVPTGPFAVGRSIVDWVDDATVDSLAPGPGTKRELLVWMWYPAAATLSGAKMDDYVPSQLRAKEDGGSAPQPSKLFALLTRDVAKIHGHVVNNAVLLPGQPSYPVVIMRTGASQPVVNYSTLAEDLASHGYVVVGFDAPYRTQHVVFPDGRVMTRTPENNPEFCESLAQARQDSCMKRLLSAWTADIGFTLDRLAKLNADQASPFSARLDLSRVGVFGHSLGGATAAQFCHDDSRCTAGIDLDGQPFGSVVHEGMKQPFMFVVSDQVHGTDPETRQILANIQSIYDHLPPDGRFRVTIRGANHFFFSDDAALLKSHIVIRMLRLLGVVRIDGRRQLAVTAWCVRTFFDAYLKGADGSRLNILSPRYPEIEAFQ